MGSKWYWGFVVLALFTVVVVFGAVPADTIRTTGGVSVVVVDHLNVTGDYWWTHNAITYNLTAVVSSALNVNATNEWGLVFGTTGDWFNYTDITYTPVYLGLQMHPLNHTIAGEVVIPEVYDKDDYHWQLGLYFSNGTQVNVDCLVMYYAHVEWDNAEGLEYISPNQ